MSSARPQPATDAVGGRPSADEGRRAPATLSCLVPCHNEAANLQLLLPRLQSAVRGLAPAFEIVFVDDGSVDATPALLERWAVGGGVRAVLLSRNFGKEAALMAGLRAARGEVVVMLDADLQHPPELIPELLERWRDGADVVYALRHSRRGETLLKRIGSRLFYRLLRQSDRFEVPNGAGDFRLLDRKVVDALLALPERNRFMKGLYGWVGFDSVAVPYEPAAREHGRSTFNLRRLVGLSLDGITAFTVWPLRAVSLTGVLLAVLAFAYGAFLTIDYLLHGNEVGGWTTIVVSLMLLSGIQLISLGVVGEYVGRVFEEAKARPLYLIKRELGQGLEETQG